MAKFHRGQDVVCSNFLRRHAVLNFWSLWSAGIFTVSTTSHEYC